MAKFRMHLRRFVPSVNFYSFHGEKKPHTAHTHHYARWTQSHLHAHAYSHSRQREKRQTRTGDWSAVRTCACTAGGQEGERGAVMERPKAQRDAGKSACTHTQQRAAAATAIAAAASPMISLSFTPVSLAPLSLAHFLSLSRSLLLARRVEAICIAMNATNHPVSTSLPPPSAPTLAKPPLPSTPLSVAG